MDANVVENQEVVKANTQEVMEVKEQEQEVPAAAGSRLTPGIEALLKMTCKCGKPLMDHDIMKENMPCAESNCMGFAL